MPELTETGGRLLNANLYEENRERCAAPESSETGVSEEGKERNWSVRTFKATESARPLRRRKFHAPDFNFFAPVTHSKEYLDYLVSEHWADLRLAAFNRANRKCEACFKPGILHGHHLLYRRPLTDCVPEDIMALCASCHERLHEWLESSGNRLTQLGREATRGVILVLLSATGARHRPIAKPKRTAEQQEKRRTGKQLRREKKQALLNEVYVWLESQPKIMEAMSLTRVKFRHVARAVASDKTGKFRSRAIHCALALFDRHQRKSTSTYSTYP